MSHSHSPIRKSGIRRPKVNRGIATAAGLSFTTLVIHIGMGTGEILEPVLASNTPPVAREVTRACWHLVTLTLVAMTGSYAYGIRRRTPALMLTWNLLAAAFGIVFVMVAVGSGLGFAEVPQSIAFFAISAAGFVGLNHSLYLRVEQISPRWSRPAATLHPMPDRPQASHRSAH